MIIKQDIRPNKMIWVTFRKEGIHKYPAALTDPALATGDEYDVSFLGYPHRHIFHFRVWINVLHNDRDIEFIQFKRWLESLYNGNTGNNNNQGAVLSLDYKSCEMMSDDLFDIINKKYPGREIWIEISEDGENGSFIKY
jgi:frataxin-like iron-binding protein CyaY